MKKKNLKSLKLKKESISSLDNLKGGKADTSEGICDGPPPNDGSWWYCDTEGLGCRLATRGPNPACTGTLVDTCACITFNNENTCNCTVA